MSKAVKSKRLGTVAIAALIPFVALTAGTESSYATKSPLIIGYVGEQTGALSSTFGDGTLAAQARVDLQNAKGGVDGHPIKLVVADDASTPSQNLTAAQGVVAKGAIGVVDIGAFVFSAAPYLKREGLPVTGAGLDGPEWAESTYPNMFEFGVPLVLNGREYVSTAPTQFFRDAGVTKLALLSNSGSPSSAILTAEDATLAKRKGIAICYQNPSVPFTLANFTAIVLQIKQAGCNGVQLESDDSQALALVRALKDSGYSLVPHVNPNSSSAIVAYTSTGYDDSVAGNALNAATFAGAFSYAQPVPFTPPSAGVSAMLSALAKYGHYKGSLPDLGMQDGWVATDMMIKGLQTANPSFSKGAIVLGLRGVSGYGAAGASRTGSSSRNITARERFSRRRVTTSSSSKAECSSCMEGSRSVGRVWMPAPSVRGESWRTKAVGREVDHAPLRRRRPRLGRSLCHRCRRPCSDLPLRRHLELRIRRVGLFHCPLLLLPKYAGSVGNGPRGSRGDVPCRTSARDYPLLRAVP